jgi:hypothetical protein
VGGREGKEDVPPTSMKCERMRSSMMRMITKMAREWFVEGE